MLQDFKKFLAALNLPNAKFGVAISGGIDSVVLAELCAQADLSFFLIHCNFKLRGEESQRDEKFVRSRAEKYGVEVLVKDFDTEKYAAGKKLSIQVAARELRYQWFEQLHDEDKNVFVLLAHHANDDIETLLMNFFRGTGIEGLTGMPEITATFCLRPLLHHTRKEIEVFALAHQLEWVEDSSNQSNKYTRNFFRNELLPMVQKVFPAVEENLAANIRRFKQLNALYKIGVDQLKKEIYEPRQSDIIIPVHKLKPYLHTSLVYEIIKEFGFGEKQVHEIIKLMESDSGKYIESETHQIIRHRKNLVIVPKIADTNTNAIIERTTQHSQVGDRSFNLLFYPIEKLRINKSENIAQLDAGLVEFPLVVRRWQQGDYFYPLGLRKKKKLGRFFIDQKLSKSAKENVWIVESGQHIIWAVGLRIDDRFKITSSTKEVLDLSISSL